MNMSSDQEIEMKRPNTILCFLQFTINKHTRASHTFQEHWLNMVLDVKMQNMTNKQGGKKQEKE